MSTKGVYTAVSGAMAQSSRLDTIANNLANANTTAFKKDRQVFNEYLTAYEKMPDTMEVPRVPASVESFYDMNGGDKSFQRDLCREVWEPERTEPFDRWQALIVLVIQRRGKDGASE